MNDEGSKQVSTAKQVEGTAQCGPGCNCGTTGLGTKWKVIVCLLVALAATVVLARSFTGKAETQTAQGQQAFAATVPTPSLVAPPASTGKATPTKSAGWGEPLKNLAALNEVAAQKDAVFLYVPKAGQGPEETVKQQIEQAADKAQSGGTKMSFYTLDDGSQDYAQVTSQMPAPCVLVLVKGRGMSVVSSDISEGKLLEALVTASRPSGGCCPSGSGSASCPQ